jgi:hypothetical protein
MTRRSGWNPDDMPEVDATCKRCEWLTKGCTLAEVPVDRSMCPKNYDLREEENESNTSAS